HHRRLVRALGQRSHLPSPALAVPAERLPDRPPALQPAVALLLARQDRIGRLTLPRLALLPLPGSDVRLAWRARPSSGWQAMCRGASPRVTCPRSRLIIGGRTQPEETACSSCPSTFASSPRT